MKTAKIAGLCRIKGSFLILHSSERATYPAAVHQDISLAPLPGPGNGASLCLLTRPSGNSGGGVTTDTRPPIISPGDYEQATLRASDVQPHPDVERAEPSRENAPAARNTQITFVAPGRGLRQRVHQCVPTPWPWNRAAPPRPDVATPAAMDELARSRARRCRQPPSGGQVRPHARLRARSSSCACPVSVHGARLARLQSRATGLLPAVRRGSFTGLLRNRGRSNACRIAQPQGMSRRGKWRSPAPACHFFSAHTRRPPARDYLFRSLRGG
jgi:hypothetical protein